jgi:hypothetical protein
LIQDELFFEGKNRSDFERVKQKFDRSHSSSHRPGSLSSNSKHKYQSKSFEAHNDINQKHHRELNFGMKGNHINERNSNSNNMNINENIAQHYMSSNDGQPLESEFPMHNESLHDKQDNTIDLTESFNLDGFKVSEDDDDDDVSCS